MTADRASRRASLLARAFGVRPDASRGYRVLGVELDDLAFADAVVLLRVLLSDEADSHHVFFANSHTLDLAAASVADQAVLNGADFVLGDGTGVRWAARLGGLRLRANLNGTDLVPALLEAADGDGRSCFLLGADAAVVAAAASVIARRYPGWRVVGHHHGFPDAAATEEIRRAVATARPDLLLVGMGNPLQERWIAQNGDLPVRLAMGVGALFAYLSGDYRRAPAAMRRLGLEWLFVLFSQRHKASRYLVGAPRFLGRVLLERLTRSRQRQGRP